jgi:hypothetical protein
MTITLTWILPSPPEPDENGEIPWSIDNGDGSMTLAMKHVETGAVRELKIDEFWRMANKAKP